MNQLPMNDGGRDDEVAGSVADATHHIKGVLEAAERAATATVEQARAEGARRVGEAKQRAQELVDERRSRIGGISDDLLRQADAVEARLAKLDDALAGAMEDLRRELERLPEPPADSGNELEDEDLDGEEDGDEDVGGDPRRAVFTR